MIKIGFRLDCSSNIGLGHFERCYNLSQNLKYRKTKIKSYFIIRSADLDNNLKKRIKIKYLCFIKSKKPKFDYLADATETIKYIKKNQISFLFIDNYKIDYKWEKIVKKYLKKLIIIDDLANRKHLCDILIDYSIYRNKNSYKKLVQSNTNLLLGHDYFLFKKNFVKTIHQSHKNQNKAIISLIINLGGFDKNKNTLKILNLLERNDNINNLKIYTIVGMNYELKNNIQELINKKFFKKNTISIIDYEDIYKFYAKSDIAIGTGGVSSYERLMFGLPTIQISLYENQKYNTNRMKKGNLIVNLNSLNNKSLTKSFNEILEKREKINLISKLIYNLDAYKVISSSLFKSSNPSKIISLIPVIYSDWEFLLKLQNIKNIRSFFINPKPVSEINHKLWLRSILKNNTKMLLKIKFEGYDCGFIQLHKVDQKSYIISIIIHNKFQNKKIALNSIRKIQDKLNKINLIAFINEKNTNSIRLFKKLNFLYISKKNGFLKYKYSD